MKDKISPEAFIAPVLSTVEIDMDSPSLKEKFQEDYRDKIQRLWEEFLVHQRIRKYAETHPLLLKRIEDTPLSVRAKNGLTVAGMNIVADITLFSPAELRMFRNMGAKTIQEIKEYVLEAIGMDVVYDEPNDETIAAIN